MQTTLQPFEGIYTSQATSHAAECLQHFLSLVNKEMNELLLAPYTDQEIKPVAHSLVALKAPGPNSFNRQFFHKHWDTVGKEACHAFKDFFSNNILLPSLNDTLVALTPKVPNPEKINQLRPISYYNFIYKTISRLLVLRLKKHMNSLISPHQSAFVGGRMIQDNIFLAHEAFHILKRKNKISKEHGAIKLDMNKAYDR